MFCLQAVQILPIGVQFLQLVTLLISSLIVFVGKSRPVFYRFNTFVNSSPSQNFEHVLFCLTRVPLLIVGETKDERVRRRVLCEGCLLETFQPSIHHCWTVPFTCHSLLGSPHRDRFWTIHTHISLIWFGTWTVFLINSISGTLIAIVFTL